MIKVTALDKAFGGLRAVEHLSFEAAPNRITSIIGPNGAGKSTAFNLIAGALRPDSGTIELDGRDITGQAPYWLTRLGVARSFQITNLFFGLTVFENIRLACQSLEWRSRYLARFDRLSRPQEGARAILRNSGLAGQRGRARRQSLARRPAAGRDRALHGSATPAVAAGRADAGHVAVRTGEIDALIKSRRARDDPADRARHRPGHEPVGPRDRHAPGREAVRGNSPIRCAASPLVREAYLGVEHAAA